MSKTERRPRRWRVLLAIFIVMIALAASSAVTVRTGSAVVVTRFGEPVRIHIDPGLHWRLPPPIERDQMVDLRLRTTSSGRYNVQVADGSILVAEAYLVWQVAAEASAIQKFLQVTGNRPEQAAGQLRSILGAALQTTSGSYRVEDLLNTDPQQLRIHAYEADLLAAVQQSVGTDYGIEVSGVGFERLMVPDALIDTTIIAMVKDREVLAERRRGAGLEQAGIIMAEAEATARQIEAEARSEAAAITAHAEERAAAIEAQAHDLDPELYRYLRHVDVLRSALGKRSSLILRTDSAPLNLLVEDPYGVQEPYLDEQTVIHQSVETASKERPQ